MKQNENLNEKPKILMLHAFRQNGKIFRQRSKNFVKILSNQYQLKYPTAPIKLNPTKSCPNPYCWYQYPKVNNNNTTNNNEADDEVQSNLTNLLENYKMVELIGFCQCLKYFFQYLIDECMDDNLPFIGLISFSQGSTIGTILIWLSTLTSDEFEEWIIIPNINIMNKIGLYGLFRKYGQVFLKYLKIKACVLQSGHLYPLPKQLENSFDKFVDDCHQNENSINWKQLQCFSLHTYSPNDEWVSMDKAKDLLPLFEHTESIEHDKGHQIWNNKYIAEWVSKHLT